MDATIQSRPEMKTVSIHQPHYLPWFGLIEKIASSDIHVVLDDVQFRKRYFQNRAQYSSEQGPKLLTIPVNSKSAVSKNVMISEIGISDPKDLIRHWQTLRHRYSRSPGWASIEERLSSIYHDEHDTLLSLNMALLSLTLECYNIDTPLVLSSSLPCEGTKGDKILALAKHCDATHYYSGSGAKSYLCSNNFQKHAIEIVYQALEMPRYDQGLDHPFIDACFALEYFLCSPSDAQNCFQRKLQEKLEQHQDKALEHYCL